MNINSIYFKVNGLVIPIILFIVSSLGFYFTYKMTSNQEKTKDFLPINHQNKKHISRKGGVVIGLMGNATILINNINTVQFYHTFVFCSYLNIYIFIIGLMSFIVGLVDDLLKKQKGLNNLIRIILWYSTAGLIVYLRYKLTGGVVFLPFLGIYNLGVFYIPFALPFFVGVVNGVNMTDGLDGLVTFPIILNLLFFVIVGYAYYGIYITYIAMALIPIMLSFLAFNLHPAKLFMGDSGAIFLGSILATLYLLTGLEFFFPIVGFIFTANFFSSFLQVFAIKMFNKRIFKMAPLHHHFEILGYKEKSIVYGSWLTSLLMMLLGLCIFCYTFRGSYNFFSLLINSI